MEHLPFLALVKICKFLTVKDIGSCCATSKTWRDVFNQDFVWRSLCDTLLAGHLKVTECQVEPVFVSPEPEDSTLTPICNWRLSYMREAHLCGNWKRQRFAVKYFGSTWAEGRLPFLEFVGNNHVIMKLQNDRKVMLWDVSGEPLHLSCPASLETHKNIDLCEILDDGNIVFLQFDIIQIFSIVPLTSSTWTPLGVYRLSPLVEAVRTAFVADNKVVAVRRDDFVEVFDLNSCKTLEMTSLPEHTGYHVHLRDVIHGDKRSKHFAVVFDCNSRNEDLPHLYRGFTVYVYSLQKLTFVQFKISIPIHGDYKKDFSCLIHENRLVIFNNGLFTVYNYLTSEMSHRTSLRFYQRNDFDFSGVHPIFLGFDVFLVPTFRRIQQKRKNMGRNSSVIVLNGQHSNAVTVASKLLGLEHRIFNQLFETEEKANPLPPEISNIPILNRIPRIIVNEVHTKYLNMESPEIVSYW